MRYEIRELGVGGILDQAIALVKDHLPLLLGIMLLVYVPVDLVQQWVASLSQQAADKVTAKADFARIFLVAKVVVAGPITNGAIIHAVARSYLQEPITAADALGRGSRVFVPMLGTMLLRNLLIALGCLLIIPGIIFFAWWLLSIQVVVLEGLSGMDAMRRSRQLMKGSVTTGVLLGLTLFVIELGLAVAAEFIANAPLRVAADVVIEATFFVFTAAAWVVFYFSCRSKHERFDLAVLADAVGAELAAETTLNAAPEDRNPMNQRGQIVSARSFQPSGPELRAKQARGSGGEEN